MDLERLETLESRAINRRTCHQLHHVLVCLKEDDLHMFWVSFFQLLLQIAATVLILAQPIDFAL